ncbi:FG-GAP repeat domain-containing protein [Leifsonia virtsii]|uniref:VCBS repeat-containing protein n=1 Tax=Leifsonia virtsii TaxID=3035915 RepID=A0ABT8IXU7_9MICO|nr:VCBS repeat-containing protein [Leifsonia virtsii]MDN4597182.1 VCBS repeat-containing protein [Leifsonia virtsii]
MRRLRLRVALAAVIAMVVTLVAWPGPALAAAAIRWSPPTATTDCTTLQAGFYHSLHVTATISGLPASTTYTVRVYDSTSNAVGADGQVTTDTQGGAALDFSVSGAVVSGDFYSVLLSSGPTVITRAMVNASTCASGVAPTGNLSADAVCSTRFLGNWGDLQAFSYRVHGTVTGFVPGETYTLSAAGASGAPAAVADATGAVAYDFTVTGPLTTSGAMIQTTSQAQPVGEAMFVKADPCPAMKTDFPSLRPTESDVNGDGQSDLLAIDYSGRLLYYQNESSQNAGGVPFTTSRVIGSGWGPQYGIRMQAAGDLTGDGYSELVVIRSDGALVAYYNNINSNAGRMPYASATLIGSGWQPFVDVTLGDVNHDGFADLIAERSDHTYWLYMNHFATNPGHQPFTSGVRIAAPGYESAYGMAAVDANTDGFADLWSYSGWMAPNLTPAGATAPFGAYLAVETNALSAIGALQPQSGWAVGHYSYSPMSPGVLIANPNGNGSLVYIQVLDGTGTTSSTVIGSGWQSIRTLIS